MQIGRIASILTEEAGQDSEIDENVEILELEKRDFDDVDKIDSVVAC
jgi:hypothetical protein